MSLFENGKVFLIENTNDKILPYIKEIANKNNSQEIYLFSENLDKKSKLRNFFEKEKNTSVIPCYLDNEISIKKIISKELKDYKNLTAENINLILENSNLDRTKVNNELDKIKIF